MIQKDLLKSINLSNIQIQTDSHEVQGEYAPSILIDDPGNLEQQNQKSYHKDVDEMIEKIGMDYYDNIIEYYGTSRKIWNGFVN